jgi:pimeloyl-ACP methyl ester carboxylesterase
MIFMQKLVVYNHGKDSVPWGEKPLALARVAERRGFHFISPDYTDSNDPDLRVQRLLSMDLSDYQTVILVGSSMGAYVACVAAETLRPAGLFLMAPALYLPGYACQSFNVEGVELEVFHGWRDDIVPPEHAWRFCQAYNATLHMLDTDHRLLSVLPQLADAFDKMLLRHMA